MKEPDLKKIRKAMEKELDPKRYEHTLGRILCTPAELDAGTAAPSIRRRTVDTDIKHYLLRD